MKDIAHECHQCGRMTCHVDDDGWCEHCAEKWEAEAWDSLGSIHDEHEQEAR